MGATTNSDARDEHRGGGAAGADATQGAASGQRAADGGSALGGAQTSTAADDESGEAAADDGPTADELLAQSTRDQKLVAWLIDEGYPEDHPTRVDAAERAAASEQAWKGTRPGVGVSQRLVWAEKALARAKRAQAKQEQAIDELDNWYEHERIAQCQYLNELRDRTHKYEDKLADISTQAAAEFRGDSGGGGSSTLRDAVDAIEGDLGPTMRELMESMPEGSAIRSKISGALGTLSTVYSLVTSTRGRWADEYDIGDEDGAYGGGDPEPNAAYGHGANFWQQDWYDQQWEQRGHWHEWPAYYDCANGEQTMDTADVQVPPWMQPEASRSTWDYRAWKRGRREDQDAQGTQGRQLGDESISDDHERAARLQAQCQDAAALAAGAAQQQQQQQHQQLQLAGPAAPTPEIVDQELEDRKQAVWDQAQSEGVEISCQAIASMAREELEEWAAAHLEQI